MPTEMTIEAAIIELNRLKTTERMDIDRDRLTAAIDVLKDAAQFRIKREPNLKRYKVPPFGRGRSGRICQDSFCPQCDSRVFEICGDFCPECGQALDWSDV